MASKSVLLICSIIFVFICAFVLITIVGKDDARFASYNENESEKNDALAEQLKMVDNDSIAIDEESLPSKNIPLAHDSSEIARDDLEEDSVSNASSISVEDIATAQGLNLAKANALFESEGFASLYYQLDENKEKAIEVSLNLNEKLNAIVLSNKFAYEVLPVKCDDKICMVSLETNQPQELTTAMYDFYSAVDYPVAIVQDIKDKGDYKVHNYIFNHDKPSIFVEHKQN